MLQDLNNDLFIIDEQNEGIRIDKLLSQRYESRSRSYFQYLIEKGLVLINGQKIKKRMLPKKGDEIEIFFELTAEISLEPQDIPLDILYEDEDIIVINKPSNMVVHPAPGNWTNTFVNALLFHCKNLFCGSDLRPGIVHRLDKDTSGVLIAAKNSFSHKNLVDQFSQKSIKKEYLLISLGKPQDQEINTKIARDKIKRQQMAVSEEGKEAITKIQVLDFSHELSLVKASPLTGRTHQIRVHMKHIRHPILGDEMYGNSFYNKKFNIDRQLLHAHKINFLHPTKNIFLNISAPIPQDFTNILNSFSKKNLIL